MKCVDREGELISARVQNVSVVQSVPAPTSVLSRDAGEEKGGGLNDCNFWNELNACRADALPRPAGVVSRTLSPE